MELVAKGNQPREMNLKSKVQLKTQAEKSGEARMLQTSALLLEFADGKKTRAATQACGDLGAGRIEWTDAGPQNGTAGAPAGSEAARTNCRRISSKWNSERRARRESWFATGNVLTERAADGRARADSDRARRSGPNCWLAADGRRWICRER